ncbi:MAG: hypothetical protein BWY21_00327 [Parcubacteria group bacterium ADurb.Bin216]|nr:MAG: hypothetical protein BWY21_00327 [Parcubacteria group bacterium ADurb.Bin216]
MTPTTLEEFIEKYLNQKYFWNVESLGIYGMIARENEHRIEADKKLVRLTAAEILRVAEEWCNEKIHTGATIRRDDIERQGERMEADMLYDFLKSYITGPSTSEEKEQ